MADMIAAHALSAGQHQEYPAGSSSHQYEREVPEEGANSRKGPKPSLAERLESVFATICARPLSRPGEGRRLMPHAVTHCCSHTPNLTLQESGETAEISAKTKGQLPADLYLALRVTGTSFPTRIIPLLFRALQPIVLARKVRIGMSAAIS